MSNYDVLIEQKGEDKIKFNLCDHRGQPTRARGAFKMSQFPQLALKMQQGETVHSDREPPYASREQLDFSGGRGWDDLERDKSRFYDSYRAQTWLDGVVLLGPEETYVEGIRAASVEHWFDDNADSNDDMDRVELTDDEEYYSYKFTADATFTPKYIYLASGIDLDITGWALVADVYSDSGGEPDSSLMSTGDQQPVAYEMTYRLEIETPAELTNGVTYHMVFRNYEPLPVGWERIGYYLLAADTVAASTAFKSDDGSTWEAADKGIFFRLVPDESDFDLHPFEHLGALYMALSFRDGSDPKIFMNGERGTATSATSTTLTDSGATFTVDDLIGAIVLLYSGRGSDVDRAWRLISDNTGTEITVAEAWDETPDETTKYVVMQRDVYNEVTGHGMTGRITDVCSYGNVVYFARGDFFDLYRMYDDAFTLEDGNRGTFILDAPDSATGRTKIFVAKSSFPPSIVSAEPYFSDDGIVLSDLELTYDVNVVNANCELDDATWASYGAVALNVRDNAPVIDGSWARGIQASAADSGATQTIDGIEPSATYRGSVWVYGYGANDVKLELNGVEVASTSTQGAWVNLSGYQTATGETMTFRVLSKGGAANYNFDAAKMDKVESPLPGGHDRITGMVVAGDPKRLYIMTDAGMLLENYSDFRNVSPGEFLNMRDYRNGVASLAKGEYIYLTYLNNVVKYFDQELSFVGPDIEFALPANRRGAVRSMVSYGEWILVALDGGEDNYSSILLYNGVGWHDYYRAPAAGMRITKLWIQAIPGEYTDRLWFNEGSDIAWLGIDINPLMNENFRYTFSSWIDQASIYGSMGETEKFFQSIKVTGAMSSSKYVSLSPRDEDGYTGGGEVPTGEVYETLWGNLTSSPADEITIDEFYSMAVFTLNRLQVHIGLHTTRPTLSPEFRSIVIDFLEHIPVAWGYTMRLVSADNRPSLTGERSYDRVEDDITILKGYLNDAEPVRIFTPFSYANEFTAKLTSITDIEPVGYSRRGGKERIMFVLTCVDA